MLKSNLMAAIQFEIRRYDLSKFTGTDGRALPALINRLSEANHKVGREGVKTKRTIFSTDGRRKHHHYEVTIFYFDGRVYADLYRQS